MEGNLLANIIPHLAQWWGYLLLIFYLAGLILVVSALMGLARPQKTMGRSVVTLVAGILFLNFPGLLDVLATTIFNEGSIQNLSYQPPASEARLYIQFSVYLIAILGLVGIGRGLWLLKASAVEAGQLGRGVVHLVGGILCVNLVETLKIMGATLGGEVQTVVAALVG